MVRGEVIQKRGPRLWQAFLQGKKVNQALKSSLTIPCIVFISFFVLSLGIGGPAYMSDEIGYLDKAATIAGSTVHLSTSWFAGYSFMISPAFLLSSNPYVEWNIILILNALMWAGSAALLRYVLRTTQPKASEKAIFFATLGAMLYPSWVSMSGYAFATSGFVLVFMATLASTLKSKLTHRGWLSTAGTLAGYLCWIHPLGFLFLGAFIILLITQGLLRKQLLFYLIAFASLLVGCAYLFLIHPWLNHAMSGSITNDSHYTTSISNIFHAIPTLHYWLNVMGLLMGFFFFVLVATFGLVIYGSLPVIKNVMKNRSSWKVALQNANFVVMLLSILLVVGVIVFTALLWGSNGQLRIDQWVYGRYTDMYLLPLIGFGLLANWHAKPALWVAGFVIISGLLLSAITNPHNTSFVFNNKVNIQGLWPMHLASVVHANQYWIWGLLGACGIFACGLMGRRKAYLPLLLIPVALSGVSNYLYNQTITQQHASVSSLYPYIKTHYTTSDCIGFTPQGDSNERFNLYSYYLHGYNIRKMSITQWQQQDCQGPYLTYDSTLAVSPALQVEGVEAKTGLYMITRSHSTLAVQPTQDNALTFSKDKLVGHAIIFN